MTDYSEASATIKMASVSVHDSQLLIAGMAAAVTNSGQGVSDDESALNVGSRASVSSGLR